MSSAKVAVLADGLNVLLKMVKDNGWLDDLRVARNTNSIVNLQYADDTLIFGICDITQPTVLKCVNSEL